MTANNKKVIVIRHLAFEDLASFATVLQSNDVEVVYYEAGYDDLSQIDALSDDLLIILGGPISVNDTTVFSFIEAEIKILKQRIKTDKPTLGVCLGAQMIARALGAKVFSGEEKEIGWYDLKLTAAGEQSAIRYLNAQHCSMFHWHGETFELPTGATLLASSEKFKNQAFSYGKNILALQFHPEVTQRVMEKWFIGHIGEIMNTDGISVERLRLDTQRYANQLEVQSELFFNSWFNEVNF